MNIIIEKNNLAKKAGHALNEMVLNRNGKPLLVLLSGGSSLNLLEYIKEESVNGNVAFGMLDDRYSYDQNVNSNSILERSAFYLNSIERGAVFLNSVPQQFETLELYADRYEEEVKKWMMMYPDGIIRATIGIGPDGHTSGILPHPEDPEKFEKLFNSEKLIVGYDVENKNPHRYRMTSTCTLMRKFDQVLTFMSGENKHEALKKVLAEKGSLAETPGRIICELKNVSLYTDIEV